jgi:L-ribulose-5-phosphate 4-epimerase
VTFQPSADRLLPELTQREEIVLLARTLWREGYNDHLAGHITINQHDGTLLCNPWMLLWNEFKAADVIRIDLEGNVLEGDWPVPPGIPLHLQLHKLRPGIEVAMHNHPLYGTVWADMQEVPAAMDQSSSLGGGELVLVDEYDGPVNDPAGARKAIEKMGNSEIALLAGHGVFVLGNSVRAVHQRAVALEQRCRHAWHVRAAAGAVPTPLPASYSERMRQSAGDNFMGFWEAMVRQELRLDPSLLELAAVR